MPFAADIASAVDAAVRYAAEPPHPDADSLKRATAWVADAAKRLSAGSYGPVYGTPRRVVHYGPLRATLEAAEHDGRPAVAVSHVAVDEDQQRQGHFKRFLAALHAVNPADFTLVTEVVNPHLHRFLDDNRWDYSGEHEGFSRPTGDAPFR